MDYLQKAFNNTGKTFKKMMYKTSSLFSSSRKRYLVNPSSSKSSKNSSKSSTHSSPKVSPISKGSQESEKEYEAVAHEVNPMISRHTATKKASPRVPYHRTVLIESSRRPGTKKNRGKEKSFELGDIFQEKGISPSSPIVNKYKQSLIKNLDKQGNEFNMMPLKISASDTPEQISKKIKSKTEILSEKKEDLEKETKSNTDLRKKIASILDEIIPDEIPKMNKKQPDTLDKFLIENKSLAIILELLQNEKAVCKLKTQEYDEIVRGFKGEHPEYKGSLPKTSTKCNQKEIIANIKKIKDLNQDLLNKKKKKKIASKKMSGPITRSKTNNDDAEFYESFKGGRK
jgi:hypothetical protein